MVKLLIDSKDVFEYTKLFAKIAKKILKAVKEKGRVELNLQIVDMEEMKNLCQQYKNSNIATDVLSFPADWKELEPIIGYKMLGDIVICAIKAKEQAIEYGHSIEREYAYLFAHGMLHCLGYDHQSKKDEDQMNQIAEKVLTKIGVTR